MPKLTKITPRYRRHKPSGQAVVTLDGQDFYLGPWRSKASIAEYDRRIGEWLAAGRQLPAAAADFTIAELCLRYLTFAKSYYVKNGRQTKTVANILATIKLLRTRYGQTQAADFGPLALKALQLRMVELGHARSYVNKSVDVIRRIFKWAVSEQLLPPAVHQALATVAGLGKGRTKARESEPVRPVEDATVDATIPHMPPIVADMVRLQRLTGARPGEVCIVRPCDVDTSSDVWRYVPESHKTQHRGRERVVFLGPKAQDVLRPYLLRDKQSYCFVPAEGERKRNEEKRDARQTPMTPSQAARRPKRKPKRKPGGHYTVNSYRRAIYRACDVALPAPADLDAGGQAAWRKANQWHPNRLRHSLGTQVRRQFGLEAAQVALGHAAADVTQVYAERDFALAADVARKIG